MASALFTLLLSYLKKKLTLISATEFKFQLENTSYLNLFSFITILFQFYNDILYDSTKIKKNISHNKVNVKISKQKRIKCYISLFVGLLEKGDSYCTPIKNTHELLFYNTQSPLQVTFQTNPSLDLLTFNSIFNKQLENNNSKSI